MRSIGQTLKVLRTSSGLSVDDVLYRLRERNIVVSSKTLYGYENGNAIRSSTFLALCEIYSVTDVFATFLQGIPYAKEEWADTDYEDYFNGRTVNEKFDILVSLGIPSFSGYEQERSSDVFFGYDPVLPTENDWKLLKAFHDADQDRQDIIRTLLKLQ